ncbi:porin family protein [Hymenobacter cheonanensis]|uniref:porin family protein n=1 Tax=Hymenobacter sp. CA2-7 TaxID=3063993 RepID=UPI002713E032|nr:porin family protein [Hymenobacter sp. CA2-7]MDO7885405.1 porin family protein [Hymenobacter sp. CA2-7]
MLHFSTRLPAPTLPHSGTLGRFRPAACCALAVLGLNSLALAAQAQDLPAAALRQPVLFNLKSGFNLSTYTGGGYIGWQTGLKGGFTGGLSATRRLAARSAWQAELLYARKGAVRYDYWHAYARGHASNLPTASNENICRSELHYLDLPVLFTYGPGSGNRPGWYVAAGPQVSLALDREETVVPAGISDADNFKEIVGSGAEALTRWNWGYLAGIGYQIAGGNAGIELRYSGDISNVYRDGQGSGAFYAGSGNRFHNGSIQLLLNLVLSGGGWRWGHDAFPDTPTPSAEPPRRSESSPSPRPQP